MKAATDVAEQQQNTENVLEVGSMDIIPETFMEKKAAKYVEIQGLDTALYRLGQLAPRNQRARKMLDIVMEWKERSEENIEEPQPETQMQTRQLTETFHRSLFKHSVQNQKLSDKERFDRKVSRMGIGFDQVDIDRAWNPILTLSFKGKNPQINGRRAFIKSEDRHFLRDLRRNDIPVPFHVQAVKDDIIIGYPEMTSFYKEKEERRTIKTDTFTAVCGRGLYTDATDKKLQVSNWDEISEKAGVWKMKVIDEHDERIICEGEQYLKEESRFEAEMSNGFVTHTDATDKKVWIPKQFQKKAKKDGIYEMQIIKESKDKLFAKPVKHLKDHPKYITGKPVKKERWYQIETKDTNLYVIVPTRFQRKFNHVKGLWKLEVLNVDDGKMYCKPVKCLTTESTKPKAKPQKKAAKPTRRRFNTNMNQVNKRLEQLKKNGRVAL